MRGADCATDHNLIRSRLAFRMRSQRNKIKGKPTPKLNVSKLKTQECRQEFQSQMEKNMEYTIDENVRAEEKWGTLKRATYETAYEILGKPTRTHQDWFDENDVELNSLLN